MCGCAVIQHTWAEVHEAMSIIPATAAGRNDPPRYNIRPTQDLGFVCHHDEDIQVRDGMWWLVPFWAKERSKHPTFNARSETAHEKPSFRASFKSKRCLIPLSAYVEWTKNEEDEGRDPHLIHLPDNEPFAVAGLWAYNKTLDITSCSILTANADPAIEHIHHRMPIILKGSVHQAWLDPESGRDQATSMLQDQRGAELQSFRIGREINSNKTSGSQLIEAV